MTLPELKDNIRKAHTPEAEPFLIEYVFDIKSWIEPCLNPIKNHIYPHSYKFSIRNNDVVMKYKQWANDESWLPEGPGLHLLASEPKGAPILVRPDTAKIMEVSALKECVKKCKRLTSQQKTWWAEFLEKETKYRAKWASATEEYLSKAKEDRWYLKKLRKHKPVSELKRVIDQDQEERERTLSNLINKANHCPQVCDVLDVIFLR